MAVNRKRKKLIYKLAAFFLSLFMIVLTSFVGFLWLKAPARGKERNGNEKIVWELNGDYAAGEQIQKGQILSKSVPSDLMEGITLNEEEIDGRYLKLSCKKGTILTEDLLYEGEPLSDDLRVHNYNYVVLTDNLKRGDYVDIRISFSDGSDYIVLSKKKVLEISNYNSLEQKENALWLQVTEEEILRLSSAAVDSYLNEGCVIYAISYVTDTQNPAIVNYPVNEVVEALIKEDPNIVNRAEHELSQKLRKKLEQDQKVSQKEDGKKEENVIAEEYKKEKSQEYQNNEKELEEIEFLD